MDEREALALREALDALREAMEERNVCDAPKPTPAWQAWLKWIGLGVGILVTGWGGASYLFVTSSNATDAHATIERKHNEDVADLISADRDAAGTDRLIMDRIGAHEKRLDKLEARRR